MPKRPPSGLRRRRGGVPPFARIAVVCEGKVTEPQYLNALKQAERAHGACILEVRGGVGVPKTVVGRAAALKRGGGYDEVWCVIDVDSHPDLPEARQQARDNQIRLVISNPCFELWALLHFQDQFAQIDRGPLRRALKAHLPNYDKSLPFERLDATRGDATRRAAALRKMHAQNGNQVDANPSSGADQLVERIAELGQRARLKKIGR
jgi:hypothetical protein